MKRKLFFILICGSLMCTATTTVQAQHNVIDKALHDPNPEVRKLALEKSTNQSTISHVALNDRDPEIRKLALKKSNNQSTISHVALNDRDPEIRKLALKKSNNQSTISHVALNDKDPEIRKLALEKLSGPSTIKQVDEPNKSSVTCDGSNYSFFFSWKKKASNPHWTGFGFAYSDLDGLGNQANLSFSQSYSFSFNPVDVYTSLGSHWLLVGGVGVDWSRYHFKGNVGLGEDEYDGITKFVQAPAGIKYNSSKLLVYYFTFPLLLEYQLNKFFISGGGVAYLKCYSKSQIEYNENGKKQREDLGRDLNILPVNARLMLQVGFDNLSIFAYYSPFSLFKEGKGPDVMPMGAGIKLGF